MNRKTLFSLLNIQHYSCLLAVLTVFSTNVVAMEEGAKGGGSRIDVSMNTDTGGLPTVGPDSDFQKTEPSIMRRNGGHELNIEGLKKSPEYDAVMDMTVDVEESEMEPVEPLKIPDTFTKEMFGGGTGSEEMSARYNEARRNLQDLHELKDKKPTLLEKVKSVYALGRYTDPVAEFFLISLLGTTNSQSSEAIQHFFTILNSNDDKASALLKNKSNEDNNLKLPEPTENKPDATVSMSRVRQRLAENFVDTLVKPLLDNDPVKTKAFNGLIAQAKNQISSGSGLGAWPLTEKNHEELTLDVLLEFTACRKQPINENMQEELMATFKPIQEQLTDENSKLVGLLSTNSLTTLLGPKRIRDFLDALTATIPDSPVLNKNGCVVFCQAARDASLRDEMWKIGLNPDHVDMLAKFNMNMNYFDTSQLSKVTNDLFNQTVRDSDEYTREFFDSEIYKGEDYKKDGKHDYPNYALAALWIASNHTEIITADDGDEQEIVGSN